MGYVSWSSLQWWPLYYIFKSRVLQKWAQIESQQTDTKQQELFLNPSSPSEYTDSFYHSPSLSFLCQNTTSPLSLSVCGFKSNQRCLFVSLSWALWLIVSIHSNPLLSIINHGITSSGEVTTCSATEGTIEPLKSPKIVFSVYTEKHYKTREKSAKSLFIGLLILWILPYIPSDPPLNRYPMSQMPISWFPFVFEQYIKTQKISQNGFMANLKCYILSSIGSIGSGYRKSYVY